MYLLCALAVIGSVVVFKYGLERWRTRKDKGYDANKWGAF
jgi:hypothetical protein